MLVFIHFTRIQLPNCVILVWGTLSSVWTVRFAFVNIQQVKTKIILVVNSGETKFQQLRRFALAFIHSHSGATGVFAMLLWKFVAEATSCLQKTLQTT